MAFDFTCLATRKANTMSASSCSLGARFVTTFSAPGSMRPLSRLCARKPPASRSEEHTSELQSLMRISYAVFCLKKKKTTHNTYTNTGQRHCTHDVNDIT